jgi:hypothetical protein
MILLDVMNRRTLLKLGTLGTAGLALPGWLRAALFQGKGASGDRGRDLLEAAWSRARLRAKPLLVLVIPRDPEMLWEQGALFGGVLNKASTEALADFVLCEFVCVPADAVSRWMPNARFEGDPLAILVEARGHGADVSSADPELPPPLDWTFAEPQPTFAEIEARALERVKPATAAIRSLVLPDRATLARRAEAARSILARAELDALAAMSEGGAAIDSDLADRGAAILREIAEESPDRRDRIFRALREAAARRILEAPPGGAKWANQTGCGIDVEGEEEGLAIACGMGFVPEASRRLLWFYTQG